LVSEAGSIAAMLGRAVCVVAVSAATCALCAGCGSTADRTARPQATPASYVHAVEELLAPPARMASLISAQSGAHPSGAARRSDVDAVLAAADRELADMRAIEIDAPVLARQRDALIAAYPAVISTMRRLASPLVAGDRGGITAESTSFFSSVRSLSSVVSPPSR
jgi:hypothetical protein